MHTYGEMKERTNIGLTILLSLLLSANVFAGGITLPTASPADIAGKVDKVGDKMTGILELEFDKAFMEFDSGSTDRGFAGWDSTDGFYGLFYSSRIISGGNGFFAFRPSSTEWEMEGSFVIRNGGRILVPDGTDGAPSNAYDDDPDTGWRRILANTQAAVTQGTQRFVIGTATSFFSTQLGVGSTGAFNPEFTVISTDRSSHPFPSMTVAQRDAIASPEESDFVIVPGPILNIRVGSSWREMYRQFGTDVSILDGGTGASTALAGFDNLSPLTTKGDVIAYSTTNARLPVGTNGQVLTADSVEVLGMKWVSVLAPTIKSGSVPGASFAGNPKIFTVTLNTAFPDANYALSFLGEVDRGWVFSTKLAGSFIIDTGSNTQPTGDIDWTAVAHNDP